jgi:hypothetical protein
LAQQQAAGLTSINNMILGNHLDFRGYEGRNFITHNVSVLPTSAKKGQRVFLTTDNKEYFYNGTIWVVLGSSQIAKFSQDVGDGTLTNITVPHGLATKNVVVSVMEKTTGEAVIVTWKATTNNDVVLTFGVAPTTAQFTVTVIG